MEVGESTLVTIDLIYFSGLRNLINDLSTGIVRFFGNILYIFLSALIVWKPAVAFLCVVLFWN